MIGDRLRTDDMQAILQSMTSKSTEDDIKRQKPETEDSNKRANFPSSIQECIKKIEEAADEYAFVQRFLQCVVDPTEVAEG